jgi:hypothetical protein
MDSAKPNGPAAAGTLAAGVGCAVIGIAIILATASPSVKNALTWSDPVGPLSGKTGVGVIAWVLCWIILHFAWKTREVSLSKVLMVSYILFAIGFLGTFPTVFEAFAAAH